MKITRTIELNDEERLTVSRFMNLVDKLSDIAGCELDDVFTYFIEKSEFTEDNGHTICALHQIDDIKYK